MKRILLSLVAVTATVGGLLIAQEQQPGQYDQQDPQMDQQQNDQEPDGQYEQGRGVARISVINGDVSVRRGDSGDVVAAALNAPIMANDTILTGSSSRAEVQLDSANMIRVGPNSEVRFTGVDVKGFQIQIAAGTATYRVLRSSAAQAEVDTPSVAIHPQGRGSYRFTVREDGTSEITVREGEAQVFSPHGSESLGAGRTMYARGQASDPEFQVNNAIAPDSWDRWNAERDQFLLGSRAYDHVSRDVAGAEDLDQYGQWTTDPNYGQVWQPRVDSGWAPYRDGRWTWEDYYGWTWVSDDPWGWAPYHYGRWFNGSAGWCWYPGSVFGHYYWSPAYVGFFGFGGHVGFGFGFGGLGWVPLAPFERYHPWYGRGFYGDFRNGGFGRNTHIVNNSNITNVYRNARVNGGVTGVNANQFGRGGSHQVLNHSQIQQAGLVRGAVPVAPGRQSLQMSNRAASGNFPQRGATSFASHTRAPQVNRVPFAQQQRGMQQLSRSDMSAPLRSNAAGNSGFSRSDPASSSRGNLSPNRGSSVAGSSLSRSNSPSSPATNSGHGWNRFGEPIHGNTGGSSSGTSRSTGGFQRSENTRPSGSSGSYSRSYSGGGGQAIRISPPIVQQRSAPSYQSPSRSYSSPSYQAPSRSYASPSSGGSSRSYSAPSRSYSAPSRSYSAPSRSYSAPSRSYSAPSRSYSAPSRSYSAPSRSSSAPSRSYSAPSRSSGGGGGGSRSSGSGSSHSSGGGHGGGHR